ncbi:RDD family protein [Leucothrix mucor]|uniref:RDD family protein n=1 Tax=Leucothrix mucor TaxID=45248 RepID=UPI0003B555E7|nr:RDD family protein [Leucothrix mucor]
MSTTGYLPASFLRRIGAIFYDSMLVVSFLFVAGMLSMKGMMLAMGLENVPAGSIAAKVFFVYLVLLAYLFFAWFWIHGGQTLGMRAWKVKLIRQDGMTISWGQAFLRFCYSIVSWVPLGAGYLWSLIDKDKQAWHDKASHSYLIDIR